MKFLQLFLAMSMACTMLVPGPSQAQTYPSRTIQFVVPYTPGTTADVLARLLAAKIAQRWNATIIVENKTGASGIIGTASVAKAAPDGYTFLFAATSFSTLAAINPKLPYDSVKGFAPVSLLGTSSMTLVVTNDFPAKTVGEFVAYVKKNPGLVDYASPGAGSSQHLSMELFKQESKTDMQHVPYKGSSGVMNDIMAGHVKASVVALQSATPFAHSGSVRMLAIMSRKRAPTFPDVPTMLELGYPSMLVDTWYGVMAPAGTPAALVDKMSVEINSLLQLPEIKEAMAKQGVDPAGGAPKVLDTLMKFQHNLWTQVVARGKIVVD